MDRPRVLIADDHQGLLDRVVRLLSGRCDVVGTATDGCALLDQVNRLQPDVIILDISMPGKTGLQAARLLSNSRSNARIVFVSIISEDAVVSAAFKCGASGYVLKDHAAEDLMPAVRAVAGGQTYLSPSLRVADRAPAASDELHSQ